MKIEIEIPEEYRAQFFKDRFNGVLTRAAYGNSQSILAELETRGTILMLKDALEDAKIEQPAKIVELHNSYFKTMDPEPDRIRSIV